LLYRSFHRSTVFDLASVALIGTQYRMRVLLVDDDTGLAELLSEYFTPHGATMDHVTSGVPALQRLVDGNYDVVLLDVMLPGDDGFEVCRKIRSKSLVPILMLTARGDDHDRIVGLDLGADDYVPKPFNPRELMSRIRAVLRRTQPTAKTDERLEVGDVHIDVPAHAASVSGAPVTLTSFEFRLLVALARRAGEAMTREDLARALKGGDEYDPSVDRSLDVHISHLRQKLGDDARDPKRIRTVRGVGYVLVRPAP
jgi:DNA-binding response OmpR family regulator